MNFFPDFCVVGRAPRLPFCHAGIRAAHCLPFRIDIQTIAFIEIRCRGKRVSRTSITFSNCNQIDVLHDLYSNRPAPHSYSPAAMNAHHFVKKCTGLNSSLPDFLSWRLPVAQRFLLLRHFRQNTNPSVRFHSETRIRRYHMIIFSCNNAIDCTNVLFRESGGIMATACFGRDYGMVSAVLEALRLKPYAHLTDYRIRYLEEQL